MFQKANKKADAKPVEPTGNTPTSRKIPPTIISSDIRILGNLVSDGMVDIDGRVEGNVKSQIVYIRENGTIVGDLMIEGEAHIFGAVHGVIKSPRVCIYESAHIEGVILHKSLSIADGAYVDAQFKPFDSQPRITGEILRDNDDEESHDDEDYDILKDLKLVT